MQIKTTIRYYYTPIRMAKIQKPTTPNAVEDMERQEFSFIVGWNEKWYSHFGSLKDILAVFYKTKYTLTLVPSIVLPGVYSKGLKIYIHTKTCMCMFIVALFTIAKIWKQPRCPSVGD